jgi:hypothetical protein
VTDVKNVVLVHGGFVDGSGWQGVYELLTADGFRVSVVQNQTLSLESDVETTHNVLDQQDGPAILFAPAWACCGRGAGVPALIATPASASYASRPCARNRRRERGGPAASAPADPRPGTTLGDRRLRREQGRVPRPPPFSVDIADGALTDIAPRQATHDLLWARTRIGER